MSTVYISQFSYCCTIANQVRQPQQTKYNNGHKALKSIVVFSAEKLLLYIYFVNKSTISFQIGTGPRSYCSTYGSSYFASL